MSTTIENTKETNHGWPNYSYEATLEASDKINWRVEDLIGGDKRLDFTSRFFRNRSPVARHSTFSRSEERLTLNQIRGHGYLYMFGLVEEFILPFVLDHARPMLHGNDARVRAFLNFASEEAKHIDLFKRFRADFLSSFPTECEVIGPPEAVAQAILSKASPGNGSGHSAHRMDDTAALPGQRGRQSQLDPQFKSLLRHHWMEESQHAKLDTLMVHAISETCSAQERANAINGYLEIGGMLDGAMVQQVKFDFESLKRATGRAFTPEETNRFLTCSNRDHAWTFLGSGMSHQNFLNTAELVSAGSRTKLEEIAPLFS